MKDIQKIVSLPIEYDKKILFLFDYVLLARFDDSGINRVG